MWNPDQYIKAWNFAAHAHHGQTVPGSEIPYINHLGTVAMEVMGAIAHAAQIDPSLIPDPDLLVQCALLHDAIEDTDVTYEQLCAEFGESVANGVLALTKNSDLPKAERMKDSLQRIQRQPKEIWMVKLGDRITNLQPPPHYWDNQKIENYRKEAELILETLRSANTYLAKRLQQKLLTYGKS